MQHSHHEALVAELDAPFEVQLIVHPRASAPTMFQLRDLDGQVLATTTHSHDVIGCLAALHQTHK